MSQMTESSGTSKVNYDEIKITQKCSWTLERLGIKIENVKQNRKIDIKK